MPAGTEVASSNIQTATPAPSKRLLGEKGGGHHRTASGFSVVNFMDEAPLAIDGAEDDIAYIDDSSMATGVLTGRRFVDQMQA